MKRNIAIMRIDAAIVAPERKKKDDCAFFLTTPQIAL